MSDPVTRLQALDTCAVSDALDRHGIRGVVAGLRPLAANQPIAGRAVTVLLGPPPAEAKSGPARHLSCVLEYSGRYFQSGMQGHSSSWLERLA
jgi:hypothetical protein